MGPFSLLALPALVRLFILRERINHKLRAHITLAVVIVWTSFILQMPAFLMALVSWIPKQQIYEEEKVSLAGTCVSQF